MNTIAEIAHQRLASNQIDPVEDIKAHINRTINGVAKAMKLDIKKAGLAVNNATNGLLPTATIQDICNLLDHDLITKEEARKLIYPAS